MKNIINNYKALAGFAILAIVFGVVSVGAFPANASAAYYYNAGGNGSVSSYGCDHPYTYPNGYYYCPARASIAQPTYPTYQPQPPVYQPPVYQAPQYPAISATCYANSSSVAAGTSVTWTAYASGGAGYYTYNWNGSDSLYGSGQTAYMNYSYPGTKTASVTVYSGGQSTVVTCQPVSVYAYQQAYVDQSYYQQTYIQPQVVYGSSNNSGLDVGCFADPTNARINQPVTWNVEVAGGAAPYTYTWTGTDGLAGTAASVIKFYGTSGDKSAVVTVSSADGRSTTRACSNTIHVGSGYVAPKPPVAVAKPVANTNMSASALFSMNNVPWGWVAILVILVLFATVMYLVFNKTKI